MSEIPAHLRHVLTVTLGVHYTPGQSPGWPADLARTVRVSFCEVATALAAFTEVTAGKSRTSGIPARVIPDRAWVTVEPRSGVPYRQSEVAPYTRTHVVWPS